MQTMIQKWGNSLGIRIPSTFAKELNLKNGSTVEIVEEQGEIRIRPQKVNLDDLLSGIRADNLHESIDTGSSVGKEEW